MKCSKILPSYTDPDQFPGFYAVFLPERCWNNSGDRVIFSDNWASYIEVNCVDVIKKSVTRISGTENKGAWSVLDVSHDLIVAQFGSLTTSPQLVCFAQPLIILRSDDVIMNV